MINQDIHYSVDSQETIDVILKCYLTIVSQKIHKQTYIQDMLTTLVLLTHKDTKTLVMSIAMVFILRFSESLPDDTFPW